MGGKNNAKGNPNNGGSSNQKSSSKGRNTKQSSKGSQKEASGKFSIADYKYPIFVVIVALIAGVLHNAHIERMFENQRFFSHLSTLERELSFRTEMGLYYSYYKEIVEANSFMEGMHRIVQCNITEFPDTVNVLRRFNLYPEVILGALYRIFNALKLVSQDCYSINRGQNLPPVQSCVGMADIAHFYVYPIFWLNGLMMSLFLILGTYLSGNIVGGLLAVVTYFYNHGESTRVMWTPPLRESFSFPFLIAQMLTVVHIIKCPRPNLKHSLFLAIITSLFMLPWQFAQFALLTQVCALFGMYILRFIDAKRILILLYGLLLAHMLNFVLQFANTLLISSFFMSAMIAAVIIVKLEPHILKIPNVVAVWLLQGVSFMVLSAGIKFGVAKLFQIKDDAHIFDILKSKFTDYQDFHTLLYVCAPEFDFIGMEYPQKLTKTLIIPCAAVVFLVLVFRLLKEEWKFWVCGGKDEDRGECPVKPYAEHLYLLLQTMAFLALSIMIMRMKLFGTPSLCLMASMLASRDLFGSFCKKPMHYAIIFLVIGGMSVEGYKNLQGQFNTAGEYSNPALETLVEWINANIPKDAVFAGAMPTMAAIKLSCGRAVVNHPHYEDAGLRARTKTVYQLYSRKLPAVVHRDIELMGVTHVILEHSWCLRRFRAGCGLPEVWDVEDPSNKGKTPVCKIIPDRPHPFTKLYHNDVYTLLKV